MRAGEGVNLDSVAGADCLLALTHIVSDIRVGALEWFPSERQRWKYFLGGRIWSELNLLLFGLVRECSTFKA